MSGITHELLVQQAARWLSRQGCAVVITDMAHAGPETADAIGWRGWQSTVVECKASLSDFRADAGKSFRMMPELGMGCLRYYCTLRGLLKPEALPPGWGLIEWHGERMAVVRKAEYQPAKHQEEIRLLLSAIRRIGHAAPDGVSVKCYTIESKNRATLGYAPLPEDGAEF